MEEIYYPPYKNGVPDSLKLTQPMAILCLDNMLALQLKTLCN